MRCLPTLTSTSTQSAAASACPVLLLLPVELFCFMLCPLPCSLPPLPCLPFICSNLPVSFTTALPDPLLVVFLRTVLFGSGCVVASTCFNQDPLRLLFMPAVTLFMGYRVVLLRWGYVLSCFTGIAFCFGGKSISALAGIQSCTEGGHHTGCASTCCTICCTAAFVNAARSSARHSSSGRSQPASHSRSASCRAHSSASGSSRRPARHFGQK